MNLFDLPDCMIEQIFEYLSYDEIAKKRLISKKMDKICQRLLNRGFIKMVRRHNTNLKRIKSLLPRRESERRNHPLARHADILTCIETRISMLSMTFSKYMELNLCCFIPGKVIDEVFRILNLVEATAKPLRAHEVLQELRDISSMAIEHFDEKIAHLLKKSFMEISSQKYSAPTGCSTPRAGTPNSQRHQSVHYMFGIPPSLDDSLAVQSVQNSPQLQTSSNLQQQLNHSCGPKRCTEAAANRILLHKIENKYKLAIKKVNRMIHIQNKQARQLRENSVTMSEMNAQIIELKRRIEILKNKNSEGGEMAMESSATNSTVSTQLNSVNSDEQEMSPKETATLILKRRYDDSRVSPINESINNDNEGKRNKTD